MTHLERLQDWLRGAHCHAFLIPSSDEYLSEFAPPHFRRLEWTTRFCGSTGFAIVLQDSAAIFLDSRYKAQGEKETAGLGIEVLDATEAIRFGWLRDHLRAGNHIALDTRLQAHPDVERFLGFAKAHGFEVEFLSENPIDALWGKERPPAPSSVVSDYPTHFAGASATEKCAELQARLSADGMDCHLLCDPEDVAWLLNVRTNDSLTTTATGWHIVPICLSRVLVEAGGKLFWFVEASRLDPDLMARLGDAVEIVAPEQFESFLEKRLAGKIVGANLQKTPHKFAAIAAKVGTLRHDPIVAQRRWRKHENEIERAREGHHRDGRPVIRFMAWVKRAVREQTVTEMDAAQKLTEFRREANEYRGISMPLMSASGASSAMPHYVPSEGSNRKLNDHPIYWMDSGGQYYGCSTDNTLCLAVGTPEARHIKAHTLVVKGYIALARARFPSGVLASQLDSFARQHLWQQGMDYGHGTGHGVGNFMNIHEGPFIGFRVDHPMNTPVEAGMIVSNEPGYYIDGDFGVRVESHMVAVPSKYEGFLEFETISRLPIDPNLIDEALLTAEEKIWLADYHARIADGYKESFDAETAAWLSGVVDRYAAIAAA